MLTNYKKGYFFLTKAILFIPKFLLFWVFKLLLVKIGIGMNEGSKASKNLPSDMDWRKFKSWQAKKSNSQSLTKSA